MYQRNVRVKTTFVANHSKGIQAKKIKKVSMDGGQAAQSNIPLRIAALIRNSL